MYKKFGSPNRLTLHVHGFVALYEDRHRALREGELGLVEEGLTAGQTVVVALDAQSIITAHRGWWHPHHQLLRYALAYLLEVGGQLDAVALNRGAHHHRQGAVQNVNRHAVHLARAHHTRGHDEVRAVER